MAERQDLNRNADPDPLGARADRGGDAERRRQDRALRIEMQLRQPHRIETPALGRIDLFESLVEGLFFAAAGKSRKLVEHAKFHRAFLLLAFSALGQLSNNSAFRRRVAIMPPSGPTERSGG